MADVGRPTVMTEETVNKLEQGFAYGFTDEEACFYANISKQTLYDYCKKHPEYTDRKEALKDQVKMKAKINVWEAINKNDKVDDSKWYLERKAKDEFSSRTETTGKDGGAMEFKLNEDDEDKINNTITEIVGDNKGQDKEDNSVQE